jgi:hypothetical protein
MAVEASNLQENGEMAKIAIGRKPGHTDTYLPYSNGILTIYIIAKSLDIPILKSIYIKIFLL